MPKTVLPSFNKGEISPELYGRVDTEVYKGGLATASNVIVHTYGGVSKRPGLKYIGPVGKHTSAPKLKRFQFKTSDSYILEFGDKYIRFIRNDGIVLDTSEQENITAITKAIPAVVTTQQAHGYSDGDEVFLSNINGMTDLNGRHFIVANSTATTFELTNIVDGSDIDSRPYTSYSSNGIVNLVYQITTPYDIADVYTLKFTQNADTITITHPNYAPRDLTRSDHDDWTLSTITFAPETATPANVSLTVNTSGSASFDYYVTAVDADNFEEGLAGTDTSNSVSLNNADNDLTWDAVANADRYRIYLSINGTYPAFLAETDTNSFTDDGSITLDTTRTPPLTRNPFDSTDNYPRAVGYYQQRKAYGGTNNKPHTTELSRIGGFKNFTRSISLQDDDAVTATLDSLEVNQIRHYVPLGDLVVLTSGGEWVLNYGFADSLTPETINQEMKSQWGCSHVAPEVLGNTLLFVTKNNSDIRSFGRDGQSGNDYSGSNLNILSRHLLEGFSVVDWTSIRYPDNRLYIVRNDGQALAFTYDIEQQTFAWTTLNTDGSFESVESLDGGGTFGEDSVYWVVKRTINGKTVRNIEVMRQTFFSDVKDTFFLDNGITFNSTTPTDTYTGLYHLEGRTVSALCDGNVVSNSTVEDGKIVFDRPYSDVHIGLPYTSVIETLNIDTGNGSIQGDLKKISRVVIKFFKSRGLYYGNDATDLVEIKQRENEAYGEAIALFSGEKRVYLPPYWSSNGRIYLQHTDPLPLTILAIIPYFTTENSDDE